MGSMCAEYKINSDWRPVVAGYTIMAAVSENTLLYVVPTLSWTSLIALLRYAAKSNMRSHEI